MEPGPADSHIHAPPGERLNLFALVIYIPGELGRFLDDLRRELAPEYNPHAHVSVLPPRPLAVDWREASELARRLIEAHPPFEIELRGVNLFPATNVVYLEVGAGAEELERMHAAIGQGPLGFAEPFPYHPHSTLAQEIALDCVPDAGRRARERWREYRGPRSFLAGRAWFVQNTRNGCWIDLAEYRFGETSRIPKI